MASAIRTSMAALIAKTRLLIGDPAGSCQTFDDAAIQDALDAYRLDVTPYELLTPRYSLSNTSGLQWLDYYSQYGYWEADVVLLNGAYATITPASSELLLDTAHWTFQASGSGQAPPVFARGKSYDIYAAAADLLEYKAATFATAYSFSVGGKTLQRGSVAPALLRQADQYRAKARAHVVCLTRGDVNLHTSAEDEARAARIGVVSSGVPFITGD